MPYAWTPPAYGLGGRAITPYTPVAVPPFLGDWKINAEELIRETPQDYRREMRNDAGVLQYRYVPITFIINRLNAATMSPFGPMWGMELVSEEWGDWVERKNAKGTYKAKSCTVGVQIVWPGQWRPVIGYGTSDFFDNNAQESIAKTRNAAISAALKSAAKNIGIGRDIEEDDPETKRLIDGRIAAIQMAYDKISERGGKERAAAEVAKISPKAVTSDHSILIDQIQFTEYEPVQRALAKLAVSIARNAAKPAAAG